MYVARLLETAQVYLASAQSKLSSKTASSVLLKAVNPFITEYQAWRRQFLHKRLYTVLQVGIAFILTMIVFFFWAEVSEGEGLKASYFLSSATVAASLLTCLRLHKTSWGRRYPEWLFLGFSWSITVVTQTSVALAGSTTAMKPLWMIVFIIQATLMPVRWRLHLVSQLSAFIYYFAVNNALGLPMARPLFDYVANFLPLFWVCFACTLSVYLYERLQYAEFSARRELEIAYQKVEAAEAKYRGIFENALDGIFQSHPRGGYITANPALAKIYGFDSPEELSKTLTDPQHQLFVDPHRYAEFTQLMQQNSVVSEFEAQVYRRDGSVIWIAMNAREVRDEKGVLLYYEGLIEDITERKRSEEALRVFFHAVSHDLRNPITGTLMVLKNLQQESGETIPLSRRILERMIQGCDRQLSLINTLLETQANEVKGIKINYQPLQLHALIQEIVSDLEPMLSRNQATSINLVPVDFPQVNADPTQLRRVFENLIANALNHNPPGITLKLSAEIEDSIVRCSIQDNGVGMPQEQSEHLFNLYTRGTLAQRSPGFGLGLYICRQIIAAHGGTIGVVSSPGAGARFWFTLPLANSSTNNLLTCQR